MTPWGPSTPGAEIGLTRRLTARAQTLAKAPGQALATAPGQALA
ncbi:MAG: hypothetical protein AAF865_04365 [Pseudomonadota bacterium]